MEINVLRRGQSTEGARAFIDITSDFRKKDLVKTLYDTCYKCFVRGDERVLIQMDSKVFMLELAGGDDKDLVNVISEFVDKMKVESEPDASHHLHIGAMGNGRSIFNRVVKSVAEFTKGVEVPDIDVKGE